MSEEVSEFWLLDRKLDDIVDETFENLYNKIKELINTMLESEIVTTEISEGFLDEMDFELDRVRENIIDDVISPEWAIKEAVNILRKVRQRYCNKFEKRDDIDDPWSYK